MSQDNGQEGDIDEKHINLRINLCDLNEKELSSLRFFFGGFGDARHVFLTFIDIHRQVIELSNEKQKYLKFSLVVNDIKPHPLAKFLILIVALRKLSEFDYEQIGSNYEATKAAAVAMYVFIGNVTSKKN